MQHAASFVDEVYTAVDTVVEAPAGLRETLSRLSPASMDEHLDECVVVHSTRSLADIREAVTSGLWSSQMSERGIRVTVTDRSLVRFVDGEWNACSSMLRLQPSAQGCRALYHAVSAVPGERAAARLDLLRSAVLAAIADADPGALAEIVVD